MIPDATQHGAELNTRQMAGVEIVWGIKILDAVVRMVPSLSERMALLAATPD